MAVAMYLSMWATNPQKDASGDRSTEQAILDGLEDITDMQSKHFRYGL